MPSIIQCNYVTKRYEKNTAIQDLSFHINSGEKVMLLGANGAGKTTTLRLLMGLATPNEGVIMLNQLNPTNPAARKNVGITPQESDFSDELTVIETIEFVRYHYNNTFTINELIEFFLLEKFKKQRTVQLSLGQKRRLALALAFVNKPEIIFLDEPTVGLDVESRLQIWSFINNYIKNEKITLLLTTHNLEEADVLVDRIIYLHSGRIKSDCSKEEFKSHLSKVKVVFYCDSIFNSEQFSAITDLIERDKNQVIIHCRDSDLVLRKLVGLNIPFYQLQIDRPQLEDAYLHWQKKETVSC